MLLTAAMTVTLATIMFAGAIIAILFLIFGFVLGVGTTFAENSRARDCLNCKRRITHNGFSVDGEDYEVARRIVRGAERLGKTGLGRTGMCTISRSDPTR